MQKIYISTHRGWEIYLTTALDTYESPRLNLYGYSTEAALTRAINRKLTHRRKSA